MSPAVQRALRTLADVEERARVAAAAPDWRTPRGVVALIVVLVLVALSAAGTVGASLALAFTR